MIGFIAFLVLPRAARPRRCCSRRCRAPAPTPRFHCSGKKFDICWNWSYCGCWRVKRTPSVERQTAVHLPVVLDVGLGVVVEHAALDELRGLRGSVGRPPPRRSRSRTGYRARCWCRCRIRRAPWNARSADVLRLEAVVVVEAGLERVAAGDLRQADRDVLRPVDVQPAGIALVGRRGADAAAPRERRAAGSSGCRPRTAA